MYFFFLASSCYVFQLLILVMDLQVPHLLYPISFIKKKNKEKKREIHDNMIQQFQGTEIPVSSKLV